MRKISEVYKEKVIYNNCFLLKVIFCIKITKYTPTHTPTHLILIYHLQILTCFPQTSMNEESHCDPTDLRLCGMLNASG